MWQISGVPGYACIESLNCSKLLYCTDVSTITHICFQTWYKHHELHGMLISCNLDVKNDVLRVWPKFFGQCPKEHVFFFNWCLPLPVRWRLKLQWQKELCRPCSPGSWLKYFIFGHFFSIWKKVQRRRANITVTRLRKGEMDSRWLRLEGQTWKSLGPPGLKSAVVFWTN